MRALNLLRCVSKAVNGQLKAVPNAQKQLIGCFDCPEVYGKFTAKTNKEISPGT